METLAIMAALTIVSTLVNGYLTNNQQNKEFGQQKELQEDAQQFQSEREDLLFERNSIPSQMQQMLDAGFNPMLSANSLLGGNGQVSATSDSSPSSPTTNSAIGALQSMIGQGGQNLYDLLKNQAEIENIKSNTNKQDIESGILPRDYALRQLTATEQFKVWDASVNRTKAAQHLDEEQTKLLQQQQLYYGRLAEAEINSYIAKTNEAYKHAMLMLEQIDTEQAKQQELGTQSSLNVAQSNLADANAKLVGEETKTEFYNANRQRIAANFEHELGDIPLTADAQRYVQTLAKRGDIKGIQNFYMSIFSTAANQEAGKQQGRPMEMQLGLPFGMGKWDLLRDWQKSPFWNPQFGTYYKD